MGDELEERLRSHARAFEGLMSLIPAKHYYGEDTSDQWQRKKQTKEQKRAAKRARLDPANNKSAKDVLDENERKRKRELELDEQDDAEGLDLPGREKPREGLKTKAQPNKKQKTTAEEDAEGQDEDPSANQDDSAERQRLKAERRKEREMRKKEKAARQKAKAEAKRERRQAAKDDGTANSILPAEPVKPTLNGDTGDEQTTTTHSDLGHIDISGLDGEHGDALDSSAPSSPARDSPPSVASAQPSASSASSIVPLHATEASESLKPDKIELPKIDKEVLKARLEAKIAAMRAARNADGPDGKPARNRQELLEARRKKEEQRKAHKKELRKQEKEDEMKAKAEAELARLRGSGSPLTTPDVFSPRSPPDANNFSFGRVFFKDGQSMDPSLTNLLDAKKRKGPSDARTAFAAAQRNHSRISGFDAEKRADIEEKDAWLNAKKKAHGERPRDDVDLLKKTLKRKQKAKMRSEKEWGDRLEGVKKGKESRQRKREDNLRKRRDEKGKKGKPKGVKTKKKGRPGFEGSLRGK